MAYSTCSLNPIEDEAVVAALVGVGFDRSQPRDLREEALRALKTMEMHDSDAVADAAVALLGLAGCPAGGEQARLKDP